MWVVGQGQQSTSAGRRSWQRRLRRRVELGQQVARLEGLRQVIVLRSTHMTERLTTGLGHSNDL